MTAHWGIDDPAAVEGSDIDKERAFNNAFRSMNNRIGIFISLPIASLGKLALQDKLREIAHQDGASTGGKVSL